jgi:glutamyl-tRNA(Gln) amidotransferase subunit E
VGYSDLKLESTSPSKEIDYRDLELKVGLEVHQQLSTHTKLFCGCPPYSGSETPSEAQDAEKRFPIQFTRILRASASELGEIDLATRFEARREIRVKYFLNKQTACLVEADEEPPHSLSKEALETSLIFALALKSRVIDEIHVMRKIVVDGSNTSGFQRTAVVSLGGLLEYESGRSKVGVQSISVEEDAARTAKLDESEKNDFGEKTYILDRLGTPLVEVALAPIEGTPEQIEDAAGSLGRLMRSSGRIARGLGTIRQDLNISILNGSVIEVKGVQKLDQISKVVRFEAARQKFLDDLSREIKERTKRELEISLKDTTEIFRETNSKIIRTSFAVHGSKTKIACIFVKNFSGFIGKQNAFGSRLGKELGAIARVYGLGGVFHSDELPNYGITSHEVSTLRQKLGASPDDAFVLIAGNEKIVGNCSEALIQRLHSSLEGVPAETRAATMDGETVFLRPRPGAARMYPETDIPLIRISQEYLRGLEALVPEPWDKQVKEFAEKYNLARQLAEQLYDSDRKDLFEEIVRSTKLSSGFVAYTLVDMLQNLAREGVQIDGIRNEQFKEILIALDSGKFAKEALPELFKTVSSAPEITLDETLRKSGLSLMSEEELIKLVRETIMQNIGSVRSKGTASQSTIMGKVMQRARGKIDGRLVNEIVSKELSKALDKERGTD